MRSAIPSVGSTDRLATVAELMAKFAVRELPVVDDGRLVGIVTRSDLDPYVGQLEWTVVRLAMTSPPQTIGPDAPVSAVARALVSNGFNGIPISVDGTLTGMISRHDLLRMVADCACDDG
jgi:CBS domain-containing protein